MALAGCSTGHQAEYSRAPLLAPVVYSDADRTLHILTCPAEFRVTETAHKVTIVFASFNWPPGMADLSAAGGSCQAVNYTLKLHTALGGRRVVDGTTGKDVPVEKVAHYRSGLPETPAPLLPPEN